MDTKKLTILFILCLLTAVLVSQPKPSITDSQIKFGYPDIKVSLGILSFTNSLVKPFTLPASSEPSAWKVIKKTSLTAKLGGINGTVEKVTFETNLGQLDCETWVSADEDLIGFRQTFTNKTKKPVSLMNLYPLFIGGKDSFSFGTTKDWRILEQFRHKNDLPKSEIPVAGKTIVCDPFFLINNNKGNGKNLLIGYQTFYLHLSEISISFDADLQLNNIKASSNFEEVELPVDGSRTSQWVILTQGDDANTLIDQYTGRIRAFYNYDPPAADAPTVYCTWYYHADNYNEEIFRKDIARFQKEHLPFDVFLIDECWDVNDWGDFEANESFPAGMKWAATQINSAGYKAGIWTAPFLVDGESDLARNHPSWLLRNSKGQPCIFSMNERDHYILDLTYPGVCAYLEEQFRKISQDWGYGYFKFDFMRSVFLDTDQQFYDKAATSLEAYRRGLEAIRRGTGKDAYISVCGGHYGASYGIANTQRSGSDVKSQWNETELPKYRQNIMRTWMSGLWHVDPDAMMVRRAGTAVQGDKRNLTTGLFSDEEAFTNTVNQFIGGNLITFTEDFSIIDPDRKMLYKHVIPSANSSSRPVDAFNTVCPEIMITPIKPICKNLGNWNMLTIVNWSDNPKDYNIALDERITGNLNGNSFIVFDFKKQEIVGSFKRGDTLKCSKVSGHNSRLLKIVPWDGKSAIFIGTDLNFSCGGVEIEAIDFNNGVVKGLVKTGWFVPVKLSFIIPEQGSYKMIQATVHQGQKEYYVTLSI